MSRSTLFALVVIVLAARPLRADFIGWQYDWSVSPTSITSTNGNSSLQLIGVSGNSTAITANIFAIGIEPPASSTDSIAATPYQLTLNLTDEGSTKTGTLTFGGVLSGPYSNLSNSFTGQTTQSLTLGGTEYTVSMSSFFQPASIFPGFISATVDVAASTQDAPEPASLTLAACALSGLALAAWRRQP